MMNKVDVCRAPGVLPDADVVVLKPNPCFEVHTHNQNSISAQSAKVNSPEKVCLRKKALDFYLKCRHLQFLRDSDFPRKLFRARHLYGWAALLLLLGAGPATAPSTQPVEAPQRLVSAMQQRISDLQDENARLRKQVAETEDKRGNRPLVIRAFELKRGMSENDVIATMGIEPNGQRKANYANGKMISWRLGKDQTVYGSRIEVEFEDGKLAGVRLRIEGLDLGELR